MRVSRCNVRKIGLPWTRIASGASTINSAAATLGGVGTMTVRAAQAPAIVEVRRAQIFVAVTLLPLRLVARNCPAHSWAVSFRVTRYGEPIHCPPGYCSRFAAAGFCRIGAAFRVTRSLIAIAKAAANGDLIVPRRHPTLDLLHQLVLAGMAKAFGE